MAAKPEGKESKPGKTFTIFAGRKSLLYRLYSHGSTKVKANVFVKVLTYCCEMLNVILLLVMFDHTKVHESEGAYFLGPEYHFSLKGGPMESHRKL